MRTIIIHYHLFKNAGTTIDRILDQRFPADTHGYIEGPHPWSTVSSRQILDYALATPSIQAISSHQARLPLPEHPSIRFLPILFLRHPIDRFGSVYEFERRHPPEDTSPSVAVAKQGGLAAFANWTISEAGTAVCRNFQVTHLAGIQRDMRTARATHDDYLQALAHLRQLPFFGLVESFDESLDRLRGFLRPYIGNLDRLVTIENISPGRDATLAARLEHIRNELGPSLYKGLLEHNALDMLLYTEAQALFTESQRQRFPVKRNRPFSLVGVTRYLRRLR